MPRTRARPRDDREAAYARVADLIADDAAATSFNFIPVIGIAAASLFLGVTAMIAWSHVRESRLPLRGTVVGRTYVPGLTIEYSDGYPGLRKQSTRERHVLQIRVATEPRPRSENVSKALWQRVKPGNAVRRENGVWHLDTPPATRK